MIAREMERGVYIISGCALSKEQGTIHISTNTLVVYLYGSAMELEVERLRGYIHTVTPNTLFPRGKEDRKNKVTVYECPIHRGHLTSRLT